MCSSKKRFYTSNLLSYALFGTVWSLIKINIHFFSAATTFLIHIGTQQLPRQMQTYIEKKHYHDSKKVADVGFEWHPDTSFQPNDISVGTSVL